MSATNATYEILARHDAKAMAEKLQNHPEKVLELIKANSMPEAQIQPDSEAASEMTSHESQAAKTWLAMPREAQDRLIQILEKAGYESTAWSVASNLDMYRTI